jgi:molybdate transport system ATP-binding protein
VALARPEGLSVQNVLPARLAAIEPGGANDLLLRLAVGDAVLLSRVTRDAAQRLGLAPGLPVWALIKAVAFVGEAPEGGG